MITANKFSAKRIINILFIAVVILYGLYLMDFIDFSRKADYAISIPAEQLQVENEPELNAALEKIEIDEEALRAAFQPLGLSPAEFQQLIHIEFTVNVKATNLHSLQLNFYNNGQSTVAPEAYHAFAQNVLNSITRQ